jgi:hypothetical protein
VNSAKDTRFVSAQAKLILVQALSRALIFIKEAPRVLTLNRGVSRLAGRENGMKTAREREYIGSRSLTKAVKPPAYSGGSRAYINSISHG